MEWYTSLPHAHRVELSDRGRISDPAISYDPSRAPPAHHEAHGISFVAGDGHGDARRGAAADDAPPSWPWFLPDTDIDLERIRDWDPREHLEVYRRNTLVRRAQILLDFVGPGRGLTSTGALNRADTAEALQRFGIDRTRSEERRVGKEWRCRRPAPHDKESYDAKRACRGAAVRCRR